MKLIQTQWVDYELLDSGGFEKLERFGDVILIRPEPQAIWHPNSEKRSWAKLAHAHFLRDKKDIFRVVSESKGGWEIKKKMPNDWAISYQYKNLDFKLKLALTPFGHVGVFPEQGNNWNFIWDKLAFNKQARVLHAFAYTGGATMVAKMAGAHVVHLDASRPSLNWAKSNMELNALTDVRWVYEDAFKFIQREVKRGHHYDGIIMDPPITGRGPDGERWVLYEMLDEMIFLTAKLLSDNSFFVLSTYAASLSSLVSNNILSSYFKDREIEYGELSIKGTDQRILPMGTFARF